MSDAFPSDEQRLALSISSSAGYIVTREYANLLRSIMGQGEISQDDYDAGVRACERVGRDAVMALHREAVDRIMFTMGIA